MNQKYTYTLEFFGILAMLGLASVFARGDALAVEGDKNGVVAIVNGTPIRYAGIEIATQAVTNRFVFERKRDPATPADLEEIEQTRRRLELKRLGTAIRVTIREQERARLKIEATDEEILARWSRIQSEQDAPSTVASIRAKNTALLAALDAVYDDARNPDQVYETQLDGKVSRVEWDAALRQYACKTARESLARLVARDEQSLADLEDAIRAVVLREKLEHAVEEELIRVDPEFAEYVRLSQADPGHEKVQSKGPNYRLAKRSEWWRQRYKEADVQIKDARFKGAWKEPFD